MGDETIDLHDVSIEELCKRFNTNVETGLSSSNASQALLEHGPNKLTPKPSTPEWIKFIKSLFFTDKTLLVWWFSSIFLLIISKYRVYHDDNANIMMEAMSIMLMVIALAYGIIIYYIQRVPISVEDPRYALARRDGKKIKVEFSQLTLGDIIEVKMGDVCPADLRIIESEYCKINLSHLTGESEPKRRGPIKTHDNPLETENLAFSSCDVVHGAALCMVVQVGDKTVMGRISGLSTILYEAMPHIERAIRQLITILSSIVVIISLIFVIVFLSIGYHWVDVMVVAVGIMVANLPLSVTSNVNQYLKNVAGRMSDKNCLVKNVGSVIDLAKTSCIFTCTAGALTQNCRKVSHLWFNNKIFDADQISDLDKNTTAWKSLERAACLSNKATFIEEQETIDRREATGNATDIAILRYMEHAMGDVMDYRLKNKSVCEIPFNSYAHHVSVNVVPYVVPYAHHVNVDPSQEGHLLIMKGAPERLLDRSNRILIDGEDVALTNDLRESFNTMYRDLGGRGENLIAFCDNVLPYDQFPKNFPFDPEDVNFSLENLRFVGVMSLIDPPHVSTSESVSKCRSSGIKVIMMTADHPITAKAIAKSVGIVREDHETIDDIAIRRNCAIEDVDTKEAKAIIVTAEEMKDLSEKDLSQVLSNYSDVVFARLATGIMLYAVECLQGIPTVVAVFGKKMNDSMAMKVADIGVALGDTAVHIVKNVADVIVNDDQFSSLVNCIEESRFVIGNLKICFDLSMFRVLTTILLQITLAICFFFVDDDIFIILTIVYIIFDMILVPTIAFWFYENIRDDFMKDKPEPQDMKFLSLRAISLSMIKKMSSSLISVIVIWRILPVFVAWMALKHVLIIFTFVYYLSGKNRYMWMLFAWQK